MPTKVKAAAPWRGWVHRSLLSRNAKLAVWCVCLLPLVWLFGAAATDQLGANPAQALIRSTGDWALRALWLALLVTPVRQWLQWPALARFRRLLGLFAFFYAVLHLVCYAWLDMGWEWRDIAADIAKRPFILVGMLTFSILLALALTSPKVVVRRMGARRWQWLHRSVYVASLLALLHFYWMRRGKYDTTEVAVYGALLGALLGARLWRSRGFGSDC